MCVLDIARIYDDSYETYDEQDVYVCKSSWENAYKNKAIRKDNYWKSARVIWFSDNNLFEMSLSESDYDYWDCYDEQCYRDRDAYFHREEQTSVVDFLSKLIDNKADYVNVGVWTLNWESEKFLDYFLGFCPSDVDDDESVLLINFAEDKVKNGNCF